MDMGSPENGLEGIRDLLKKDESILARVDINLVENKEIVEDFVYDDLESSKKNCVDMNEQEQRGSPLVPSDFGYYEISGSPEKFHSPVQTGLYHDVPSETKTVCDKSRLLSPSEDDHHREDTEKLRSSYLCKSSFQVETETFHHEIETNVSACQREFFSIRDANLEDEMEDRPTSPPHGEIVKGPFFRRSQYDSTKSEFTYKEVEGEVSDLQTEKLGSSPRSHQGNNETKSGNICSSQNSPAESRKLEMPQSDQLNLKGMPQQSKSPGSVTQMSLLPETFPFAYQSPTRQKTCASKDVPSKHKHWLLPERSDLDKDVPSKDLSLHTDKKNSASTWISHKRSQKMDDSSMKCVYSSPTDHESFQNLQRRERSMSQSPVRPRNSSSGNKRGYRNRSRSRSPRTRDYNRRSPRRRYSPRRRSPPLGYFSRHRSPKRRRWSPPHNRSTGVAKPGRNLFVAGFSFMTTERDLERKFSRFGHVRNVRIVRDKRGFPWVWFFIFRKG